VKKRQAGNPAERLGKMKTHKMIEVESAKGLLPKNAVKAAAKCMVFGSPVKLIGCAFGIFKTRNDKTPRLMTWGNNYDAHFVSRRADIQFVFVGMVTDGFITRQNFEAVL
jgi:hypothetical protein